MATTVSKAIADKTIYADKFDVVIFDEASMAYVPQVVFAASLAARNFICVGDFCQLPPIVQSSNTSILNRNIFDFCYIAAAVRQKHGHAWLCMLNIQHRMHPDIASFASQWMYGGLLLSDPNMENMRRPIAQAAPFAGRCMALADLSGMMSTCVKVTGESRINVLSALVAISLAAKAAENTTWASLRPIMRNPDCSTRSPWILPRHIRNCTKSPVRPYTSFRAPNRKSSSMTPWTAIG